MSMVYILVIYAVFTLMYVCSSLEVHVALNLEKKLQYKFCEKVIGTAMILDLLILLAILLLSCYTWYCYKFWYAVVMLLGAYFAPKFFKAPKFIVARVFKRVTLYIKKAPQEAEELIQKLKENNIYDAIKEYM